jgi:hypothetical protein
VPKGVDGHRSKKAVAGFALTIVATAAAILAVVNVVNLGGPSDALSEWLVLIAMVGGSAGLVLLIRGLREINQSSGTRTGRVFVGLGFVSATIGIGVTFVFVIAGAMSTPSF